MNPAGSRLRGKSRLAPSSRSSWAKSVFEAPPGRKADPPACVRSRRRPGPQQMSTSSRRVPPIPVAGSWRQPTKAGTRSRFIGTVTATLRKEGDRRRHPGRHLHWSTINARASCAGRGASSRPCPGAVIPPGAAEQVRPLSCPSLGQPADGCVPRRGPRIRPSASTSGAILMVTKVSGARAISSAARWRAAGNGRAEAGRRTRNAPPAQRVRIASTRVGRRKESFLRRGTTTRVSQADAPSDVTRRPIAP